MNRLLADLRIVEFSAFVAAPLGGMTMAQFGAEVIRIDPIGGAIDFARWPVTEDGASLYWAGLNKAKRSVALALDKPEGRELAQAIATAPGPSGNPGGGGIVLTNLPPLPGLDYASLKAKRDDVILLRLIGNDLYGSFGRDFATADGRRVMIIALTPRQWRALGRATGLVDKLAMVGQMMEVDLETEAGRYEARDAIAALLAHWCAGKSLAEVAAAFTGSGVLWGPFQDFVELVRDDPRCSPANPLFAEIEQPGIGPYPMPGLPFDFTAAPREPTRPAPRLGEHTDAVLSEVLGLPDAEIAGLHDRKIIAGPDGR